MASFKAALLLLLAALVTFGAAEEPDQFIDILPPNWYPGDVLGSTEHSKIEKALKDVDRSAGLTEFETAAIGVASLTTRLHDPVYHLVDGHTKSNLPYEIQEGETGLMLFTKAGLLGGVYGVVTYQVDNQPLQLAVMFSVPTLLGGDNKFHFRVFSSATPVDKTMVKQMYECSGSWAPKGYEERTEYGIHLRGTMTHNTHSRLIVWVDTSNLDLTTGPSLNAECKKKGLLGGKRCWQECTPTGWCWTETSCSADTDCNAASLICSGSCKKC